MHKRNKMINAFLILLMFCNIAYAGVNSDLNDFFSKLGFSDNITPGSAYNGQAAGYYSGGSVFLRNQVRDIQILHIDVPSYRAGCGGIDLFAGGFSFIKASQLVQFFKDIMNSGGGYALNLALETEVPEIAHSMQYLQQIAQKINNNNLNSCDMAEDLVGGLWPQTRASQQQICQDIGSQGGIFADWADARVRCTNGNDFNDQMNSANNDPNYKEYKDQVLINKNLVWNMMLKNSFLASDTELAEFFMSLSGTIVYDQNGNTNIYPPLSGNRNLIKALLNGGNAKIYTCDEDKACLNPKQTDININQNNGLNQKVIAMIKDMAYKVQSDTPLTPEEQGFLNRTTVPILKFITVSMSLNMAPDALSMESYSELIAKDLLRQYMLEALHVIEGSLITARYTPAVQTRLENQIKQALQEVEDIRLSSHENLQDTIQLIQNMRVLESEVTANMSSQLKNNLDFNGDKT